MNDWHEGDIRSGDMNVHYYRMGTSGKRPLVLAHGFTDNGLCWYRTAQALAADHDIVMVDARNHGKSGQGSATVTELAADLAAVIAGLALGRPAVMGHSVGASVVAALAAGHPERVGRIVLEDPPWSDQTKDPTPEQLQRRRAGFRDYIKSLANTPVEDIIAGGKKQHPSWHDDDFPAWGASKLQVSAEAMTLLDLGQWRDPLPNLQCPALLVYADGDRDAIVTHAVAHEATELSANINTAHVLDAGHNLRREQFDRFINAVAPFLDTP